MKKKKVDEYLISLIFLFIFTGLFFMLESFSVISVKDFSYTLIPIIILVIFFLLIHRRIESFEDTITELLLTHIPDIVYLDNSKTIKKEFLETINSAEKYIMTTGGKSRMEEYLSAIEKKLEEKEIEYYRIISGEKMTNQLYEHLLKIIGRKDVYISSTPHHLPTLLITEKVSFMALPDPDPDEFKTCLKIPHKEINEKLERYTRIWHNDDESKRIKNKEEFKKIKRY